MGVIITTVMAATLGGWWLWRAPILYASDYPTFHPIGFINKQIKYQFLFFLVALMVVVISHYVAHPSFVQVFRLGEINAPIIFSMPPFIDLAGYRWDQAGISSVIVLSLATIGVTLPALRAIASLPFLLRLLRRFGGWILIFAAINALSEELIYRGAVIAAGMGHLPYGDIALLSATLFAIAHIRGQANGVIVIMGSFLVGWFLTIATLQTHGLFWAWCVHFAQDMVIFTVFIAGPVKPLLRHDRLQNQTRA